jgi:hypothetical protein
MHTYMHTYIHTYIQMKEKAFSPKKVTTEFDNAGASWERSNSEAGLPGAASLVA